MDGRLDDSDWRKVFTGIAFSTIRNDCIGNEMKLPIRRWHDGNDDANLSEQTFFQRLHYLQIKQIIYNKKK
jgi:hypothetical protein